MGTIIMILVFAAAVFLQFKLSKKEDKRLGWILPAMGVVYAITRIFGVSISESTTVGEALGQGLSTFLLSNVPTIILITIYVGIRGKMKQEKEIEKMNLQDQE